MPERYAGPDNQTMHELVRRLDTLHDDGKVATILDRHGDLARDAFSGEPVACYCYRLQCGHLVVIWCVPLPVTTRVLFCAEDDCRGERAVVEKVT